MNECVETLNGWGEIFLGFAWPMLWQSSLLIALVFAIDFLLKRRLRAAVRYALWAVLLVKLLLPPSLAVPTGATWWLWRAHPAVESPVIKNYTVSYGDAPADEFLAPTVPKVVPPPKLSNDAWVLLVAIAMGSGLLIWLVFRWLRVAGKVRRAAIASIELERILEEARQLAGLRSRPRLKLIDEMQSPAVYGLWRPVILLPRALATKLSAHQLRTVMLHEAMHLRRGDVWANCAQTLLQMAYWWHPLLWIANARIRRVREEAVDDAVMLALRDGADAYAPALLEVAKYAFRRPLASLGLVGILESRSALRQRVERLIDFRPPRKAGITFLSLCGIFAFSAVALPMGQGPAQTEGSFSIDAGSTDTTMTLHVKPNVLIQADLFWMTRDHFESLVAGATYHRGRNGAAPSWTADPAQLKTINQRIKSMGLRPVVRPRIQTGEGMTAELFEGDATNAFRLDCDPLVHGTNIFLAVKAESTTVFVQNGLSTTNVFDVYSKVTADDDGGIIIRAPKTIGSSNLVAVLHVKTLLPGRASAVPGFEMRTFGVGTNVFLANLRKITGAQISGSDTNVSAALTQFFEKAGRDFSPPKIVFFNSQIRGGTLFVYAPPRDLDLVERIVERLHNPHGGNDRWLKSINDGTESPQYEMRTFKVDPTSLFANLDKGLNVLHPIGSPTSATNVVARLQQYLLRLGVNLDPPKALYFKDRLGVLFVYATPKDLDVIQKTIEVLSDDPPVIHIKARFIEVPRAFFSSAVVKSSFRGLTNGWVLPNPDYQVLLDELRSQDGTRELAEPEATTLSERQTQMRATRLQAVITNYIAKPNPYSSGGLAISPQISKVETGPVCDVVPNVLGDGYTIRLRVTTSHIYFLGYADPNGLAPSYATNALKERVVLPTSLPVFSISEATVNRLIYDGQTLVLFPKSEAGVNYSKDEKAKERISKAIDRAKQDDGNKVEVVFATATLIDPAGNRSHSDDEMAFAQTDVPTDQFPSSGGVPWSEQ